MTFHLIETGIREGEARTRWAKQFAEDSLGLLLLLTCEQPVNGFAELAANGQQDRCARFLIAPLYRRQMALRKPYAAGELSLSHIEASEDTNSPAYRFPIDRATTAHFSA